MCFKGRMCFIFRILPLNDPFLNCLLCWWTLRGNLQDRFWWKGVYWVLFFIKRRRLPIAKENRITLLARIDSANIFKYARLDMQMESFSAFRNFPVIALVYTLFQSKKAMLLSKWINLPCFLHKDMQRIALIV